MFRISADAAGLAAGKRKLHFDIIKTAAIYLVLLAHTGNYGFSYFSQVINKPAYWFCLLLPAVVYVSIPLFFMVSGALLLAKEESIPYVLQKRFLRYLSTLVVFSVISYLFALKLDITKFHLGDFLKTLYSDKHTVAYWYLYSHLGLLLSLPLLRKLVKEINNQDFIYITVLFLGIKLFGAVGSLIWGSEISLNPSFSVFFTASNVYYPLLGYFMEHHLSENQLQKRILILLLIGGFAAIGLTGIMTHFRCLSIGKWGDGPWDIYLSTLSWAPAVAVYYSVRYLSLKYTIHSGVARIFHIVGNCSFGIYLLEQVYRSLTLPIFEFLQPYVSTLPACFIWIFCACLLGCIVTWIMKQIPLVSKFL